MTSTLIKILSFIFATTISLDLWFLLLYALKVGKRGFAQSMAARLSHLSFFGWLIFAALCILLNVAFFKSIDSKHIQRLVERGGQTTAFLFVLGGMPIGLAGTGPLALAIDRTKGWNPYGWWFPVTFIAIVVFGLMAIPV